MWFAGEVRLPISEQFTAYLDKLEFFEEISSTNTYLMEQERPPAGHFRVALADHQTAGRGRLDRSWYAPPSAGLCMSMSYTFARRPEQLPAVTLAVGVGIVEALEELGVSGVGLKWPNDLIVRDGKLGGILTEVRSSRGEEVTIVVGVGINLDQRKMPDPAGVAPRVGYISDLASCVARLPGTERLCATLIEHLYDALATFETGGFGSFHGRFERHDWLRGQRVTVEQSNGFTGGTCEGVDDDGALMLRTESGRQRILSGSVHLRGEAGGSR